MYIYLEEVQPWRFKIRERQRDQRHLNKQEAREQSGWTGSTTPRCEEVSPKTRAVPPATSEPRDSLVGLGFVQPDAADEGAHHARDDDGEADPAGFHLLPLQDTHTHQAPGGSATPWCSIPERAEQEAGG